MELITDSSGGSPLMDKHENDERHINVTTNVNANAEAIPVVQVVHNTRHSSSPMGPQHALGWSWACSIQGTEHIALVLWIGKDWSWSQLGWTESAIFFAGCALLWITFMAYSAYRSWGVYSELYQACILWLWLAGLCAWMIGEFWTLWYSQEVELHHELVYEQRGNLICKWVLVFAIGLQVLYYAVLVPRDFFASDREALTIRRMQAQSPSFPAVAYFKEFRVYSSVHFFTWILKDCCWAWELPVPYGIMFVFTVLFNLDLLCRLARYPDLYIDFINYVMILLWVTANGLWAFGELVANYDATEEQFRQYTWPQWHVIRGASFQFRYCAGWVFFCSEFFLFCFYVHWIVKTVRGRLPTYEEFNKQQEILDPFC